MLTDKVYQWDEPDENNNNRHREWTGYEILIYYYGYWVDGMIRAGKQDLIDVESCIDDFCISNWAKEK